MARQRPTPATPAKQTTTTENKTATPTTREALIDETLQKIRQQLEQGLPTDTATLDQIEQAVAKIGHQFNQDLQRRLVEQRSIKDKSAKANVSSPFCGVNSPLHRRPESRPPSGGNGESRSLLSRAVKQ